MVYITTGELSENFCSCLIGGRVLVNKWKRKGGAWCIMLMTVTEGVPFKIHLGRNVLDMYTENTTRYSLERRVVLGPGCLGRVLHRGIHMQGSIARVPLIKWRLGYERMGATDNDWLRMIVHNALIGHVKVVGILHSTWPCDTPNWRRYILPMAFRLAVDGSRRNLRKNTDTLLECRIINVAN